MKADTQSMITEVKPLLKQGPDGWPGAKTMCDKIRVSIESLRSVKACKGRANGLEQEFD